MIKLSRAEIFLESKILLSPISSDGWSPGQGGGCCCCRSATDTAKQVNRRQLIGEQASPSLFANNDQTWTAPPQSLIGGGRGAGILVADGWQQPGRESRPRERLGQPEPAGLRPPGRRPAIRRLSRSTARGRGASETARASEPARRGRRAPLGSRAGLRLGSARLGGRAAVPRLVRFRFAGAGAALPVRYVIPRGEVALRAASRPCSVAPPFAAGFASPRIVCGCVTKAESAMSERDKEKSKRGGERRQLVSVCPENGASARVAGPSAALRNSEQKVSGLGRSPWPLLAARGAADVGDATRRSARLEAAKLYSSRRIARQGGRPARQAALLALAPRAAARCRDAGGACGGRPRHGLHGGAQRGAAALA